MAEISYTVKNMKKLWQSEKLAIVKDERDFAKVKVYIAKLHRKKLSAPLLLASNSRRYSYLKNDSPLSTIRAFADSSYQ
jgi:hypothetical protein